MNSSTADTARLFFAAWPAASVQEGLYRIAQRAGHECGGRAVAQRNIHATLAFLGDVPRTRLQEIELVAAQVRECRCDLAVDRLQYWRHNRIVWAGVERCPDALEKLALALASGLRAAGFRIDNRPYVLHVTLLRNARRAPADGALHPVRWPIHDFALVESVPRQGGRVYEVVRRWALKG